MHGEDKKKAAGNDPAAEEKPWCLRLPAELEAGTDDLHLHVVELAAGGSGWALHTRHVVHEVVVALVALAIEVFGQEREARSDVIRQTERKSLIVALRRQTQSTLVVPAIVGATDDRRTLGVFRTGDPRHRVRPARRLRRELTVI